MFRGALLICTRLARSGWTCGFEGQVYLIIQFAGFLAINLCQYAPRECPPGYEVGPIPREDLARRMVLAAPYAAYLLLPKYGPTVIGAEEPTLLPIVNKCILIQDNM